MRLAVTLAVGAIISAMVVLFVTGHWPVFSAPAPIEYNTNTLALVLQAVRSDGGIDLESLRVRRDSLNAFLDSLHQTNPLTAPSQFKTMEARLAFWLNTATALRLRELAEGDESWARYAVGVSVGGSRLTRWAVEHRYLSGFADARIPFVLLNGTPEGGVLDGAPFDEVLLPAQLNEGFRRFVSRPQVATVRAKTVALSVSLLAYQQALIDSMPEGRQSLLQVVWAFSPERCSEVNCVSRQTLDRECGLKLDQCTMVPKH